MIIICLVIIVLLWLIGGQKKGRIRDIGCPIVLGLGIIFCLPGDWSHRIIASITTIALAQVIRIGYGNYSPEDDDKPSFLASITKDRQGFIIRAIWGALVGIVTPLALVFMKELILPSYFAYIVANIAINFMVSKFRFPVFWADVLVANAFGSLLFFIAWR